MKKLFFLTGTSLLVASAWINSSLTAEDSIADSAFNDNSPVPTSTNLNGYHPNLPMTVQEDSLAIAKSPVKRTPLVKKTILTVSVGQKPGQLGISKSVEGENTGPGAFVFLPGSNEFAVLDTSNHRINVYPVDSAKKGKTFAIPNKLQTFGLTTRDDGSLSLLTRRNSVDPAGKLHQSYELSNINTQTGSWETSPSFTFDSKRTNATAQTLEIQPFGKGFLIKGIDENENHIYLPGDRTTKRVEGYPLDANATTSARIGAASNEQKTQVEILDQNKKVKSSFEVNEDVGRIRSYRFIDRDHLVLDLDGKREFVSYNVKGKTPKLSARIQADASDDEGAPDQDVSYSRDEKSKTWNIHQMSYSKNKMRIGVSELGDEP